MLAIYYFCKKEGFKPLPTTSKKPIPIPDKDENNNSVIQQIVTDYLNGIDKQKEEVINKYGELSDWDTSQVTVMS